MIDYYKVLAAADKVKASQELHEEDVEINKLLGETETIERGGGEGTPGKAGRVPTFFKSFFSVPLVYLKERSFLRNMPSP